jgi:hypothetical protein
MLDKLVIKKNIFKKLKGGNKKWHV